MTCFLIGGSVLPNETLVACALRRYNNMAWVHFFSFMNIFTYPMCVIGQLNENLLKYACLLMTLRSRHYTCTTENVGMRGSWPWLFKGSWMTKPSNWGRLKPRRIQLVPSKKMGVIATLLKHAVGTHRRARPWSFDFVEIASFQLI